MTSISHPCDRQVRAAPKVKARNLSLDRARSFLTLVVLLHHSVIPYTYFGHTDRSRGSASNDRARHRQFFMAMFFFLSGLFVWPGIAEGTAELFVDRLLRLACVRDLRVDDHSDRLLRHLAAHHPRSAFGILVDHGHEGRGRVDDLVPLVLLASTWLLASCIGCHATSSIDQSPLAARSRSAGRVSSRSCLPSPLRSTFRRIHFGAGSWFEFGRSRSSRPVLLYATYFFFGAVIGFSI